MFKRNLRNLCLRLPRPPVAGGATPLGVAPREIDFPYYSLKDGFHSTLMLVSDSPNPVDLTIGIRNTYGQMLSTTDTIQPQQKLAIDLASTIAQLGADSTGAYAEGSVAVYFMGAIMPVAGQMTVTNTALSLTNQVDMVENDPGRSDIPVVLNGTWWGLGGGNSAKVMVSNASDTPQFANVYLDFQGKRHTLNPPLSFAPYETKVLDISKLIEGLGVDPAEASSGGITIVQVGPNPALIASGKITDPSTGFSSTIDFPAPDVQLASALHATGLPIGTPTKDSPYAGAGYFVPHVVVRNLLGTPQTVTITVEYPVAAAAVATTSSSPETAASSSPPGAVAAASGRRLLDVKTGGQRPPLQNDVVSPPAKENVIPRPPLPGDKDHHPEWGADTGSTTTSVTVASFSVAAYTTEDYSLAAAMNQLPLPLPFCSVRIQYSGAPGSAEAEVSSVEAASNLIVDARAENEGNGWVGSGANPWRLDKDTDSVLFLTNMGDKPCPIGFEITANGVHYYLTKLKLNPHETRAIDIRQLRDAQLADFKGNKIPADATDGSINWIRLDDVPVMGRIMVINRHAATASSYDCSPCPCPASLSSLEMGPATNFDMIPGESWWGTCTAIYQTCNGTFQPTDVTGTSDWMSNDTAVATVVGKGDITAVAGGVAQITVAYYGFKEKYSGPPPAHCVRTAYQPSVKANCNVQVPTRVVRYSSSCAPGGIGPLEVINNGNVVNCQGQVIRMNQCGVYRFYIYQLLDQYGQPVAAAYSITEVLSDFTSTIPGDTPPKGGSVSVAAGQTFQDLQYLGAASPNCLGSNDHESFTQQFDVSAFGSLFPLTTVISISRGNFSGTAEVNSTITAQ